MANKEPWYRWYIGMLKDGTYRFILPEDLATAEKYIGSTGGAVFTHAGFLIFAADKKWWNWVENHSREYIRCTDGNTYQTKDYSNMPHINVPEIECEFSEKALKWLEENDEELAKIGGKYYDYIPRH